MHLFKPGSQTRPNTETASEMQTRQGPSHPLNTSKQLQSDHSQHSTQSQSESRSQGRDFEKDPILVPRTARIESRAHSPTSSYQRSFDQLQRGLDTLESNDSDADSDADQLRGAQRRAASMARWTARRSSIESRNHGRSPGIKLDTVAASRSLSTDLARSTTRPSVTEASLSRPASDSNELIAEQVSPLRATPGRKSIAAVFESMQKEREARTAEEHRLWQQKQARRERERAARAFGIFPRRRTPASSSRFDSPASTSSVLPDTPFNENSTTGFHSAVSRSAGASSLNGSPSLSSPASPKVDEGAAGDVQPRHLGEEAAGRIPETLAEADEFTSPEEPSATGAHEEGQQHSVTPPVTPQTPHASAFAFASQPMALDLSPVRSVAEDSSPASSPRKNAHRRQNTNTVSVGARLPPASFGAARQRLNAVLRQSSDEGPPSQASGQSSDAETPGGSAAAFPQTPSSGILSSARKEFPHFSAARRGHSVRFSPRPDYRSDSGSWDESNTQSQHANDDEEASPSDASREAAVSRLLLPAQPITIPEVLGSASASTPIAAQAAPSQERNNASSKMAKIEEMVSEPHRPMPAAMADLQSGNINTSASLSKSVRFPGAYAPSPIRGGGGSSGFSRHTIRPSPKTESPQRQNTLTSSSGTDLGLLPAASRIPRESTPPPSLRTVLPPDDPRNSPCSPRAANLGKDGFTRFEAGSSDDSTGSIMGANTRTNEGNALRADENLHSTIGKIMETIEAAHGAKARRAELGKRLSVVGARLEDKVDAPDLHAPQHERRKSVATVEGGGREEEERRAKVEQLREEVMQALAVLAERIMLLQSHPPTSTAAAVTDKTDNHVSSTSTSELEMEKGDTRTWPRWTTVLLVAAQCGLMAFLMAVAERKAQQMRMYSSPAIELRHLYHPHSSAQIEWDAVAQDVDLLPLLSIPGLTHLARSYPPLPSPFLTRTTGKAMLQLYGEYTARNGLAAFAFQLLVYAVSQLLSCIILLLLAPAQVVVAMIQPSRI